MKQLLDTIGAFMYLGFTIVVAPVLLLAHLFILALIVTKMVIIRYRAVKTFFSKKRPLHIPSIMHLELGRMKLKLHR